MENVDNKQKYTGSLLYKNQDPFFIDYYKYRNEVIEAKSRILLGHRQDVLIALYKFMDSSVDYIKDYKKKIKEVEDLISNYKELELPDFRQKVNQLWQEISADHVNHEILPKPDEQEEDLSSLDDKTRAALEAWKLLYTK